MMPLSLSFSSTVLLRSALGGAQRSKDCSALLCILFLSESTLLSPIYSFFQDVNTSLPQLFDSVQLGMQLLLPSRTSVFDGWAITLLGFTNLPCYLTTLAPAPTAWVLTFWLIRLYLREEIGSTCLPIYLSFVWPLFNVIGIYSEALSSSHKEQPLAFWMFSFLQEQNGAGQRQLSEWDSECHSVHMVFLSDCVIYTQPEFKLIYSTEREGYGGKGIDEGGVCRSNYTMFRK